MAFIREKVQELTGYQEIEPWNPAIDVNVDFVMVYGNDPKLYERIKEYENHGYEVHLMTGISWGDYKDYLYGQWDGRSHWSEAQVRENGEVVGHGVDTPYMVPTIAFADYITQSLYRAVDAGVTAIHLEEPEFWDFSGYSAAFKMEYELYYRQPWQSPQEDLLTHYRAAELKAYLYLRTIRRVAESVKEYAQQIHGRTIHIYVPTHSLINYTQWKIMSPEGRLNEIPSLDGFIAQVWTGTSRTPNMYRGRLAERTFETAYCEYSVMQELVKGTNKKMWFLADPIEDNPRYDWEDYRKSYFETVIASLLHPQVHSYEVCPWPNRVFNGKYPRATEKGAAGENSKPIPPSYQTQLNNMFQTLGDMEQPDYRFLKNNDLKLGIGLSDTSLYQRSYPKKAVFETNLSEEELDFYSSDAFPMFYGMALPLVKNGLPLRCVQLDNVLRVSNYLDDLDYLIISYDYMKPVSPAVNGEIASWVKKGGNLLYIGSENDPYNLIPAWWNGKGRNDQTPWQHLMELLDMKESGNGRLQSGRGSVTVFHETPAEICQTVELEERYRNLVADILTENGDQWEQTNSLGLRRGPYIVAAVLKETSGQSLSFVGNFADLGTPEFCFMSEVTIRPGETRLLFDLDYVKSEELTIVGSTSRILKMDATAFGTELRLKTVQHTDSYLALANVPDGMTVIVQNETENELENSSKFSSESGLLVIQYEGTGGIITIKLSKPTDT